MTMEILDLELRRCKHWEERDGFKAADVCGKQLRGVMLNSRCIPHLRHHCTSCASSHSTCGCDASRSDGASMH